MTIRWPHARWFFGAGLIVAAALGVAVPTPAEAGGAGSLTLNVDPVTWKFVRHGFDTGRYASASVTKTGDGMVARAFQYNDDRGWVTQNYWGYTYIYFPAPAGVPGDAAIDAYLRVVPTPNGYSYPDTAASVPVTVDALATQAWINYPEGSCTAYSSEWSTATCPDPAALGVTRTTTMPIKDGTGTPVLLDVSGAARAWYKAGSPNNGLKIGTPGGTPTYSWSWQFYGYFYGIQNAASSLRPAFVVEWYNKPLNLRTTGSSSSSISLAWDPNGNPGGTVFQLFRNGTLIYEGTTPAFTDTGLAAGVTYTYQARTKSPKGDASAYSNAVSGTIPAPPGGVKASALGPTSMRLTWTANGNPTGTDYFPVLMNAAGEQLSAPGWTANTYFDFPALAPNTPYRFAVKARIGSVESGWASSPATRTLANPPGKLSLRATQTAIEVTWDANANPDGTQYHPVLADPATGTAQSAGWTDGTGWTFAGLQPGVNYRVAVKARNADGVETTAVAGDRRTIPPDVTGLVGANGGLAWSPSDGRGWVTLNWQSAPGATGYLLDVFDGNAYRTFDLGDVTSWDSRIARIFPAEAYLDGFADNTLAADPWNRVQGGLDLRDNPVKLYRKTPGVAHDATGAYMFHVRPYNESGDAGWKWGESAHWYTPTLPVRTDAAAPTLTISINGGAARTELNAVRLELSFADALSGVAAARFSNDGVTWSPWQAVDASPGEGSFTLTRWALHAGPGSRSAYAQVRDRAGNVSDPATASIWVAYETANPAVQVSIDGGAETTASPEVTLAINATSELTSPADLQVQISNDGLSFTAWEPYVSQRRWTLAPGDGLKTVTVRVRNPAGYVGQALDQIRLVSARGAMPPEAPGAEPAAAAVGQTAVIARNGQPVTLVDEARVTLRLNPPPPATGLTISLDGIAYSPVEPVASTKTIILPGGDGPKTIYVRFVDDVGTKSAVHPVDVVLDSTPPEVRAAWLGNASVTTAETAELVLSASDGVSAPDALSVSLDRGASWQPFRETLDVPVPRVGDNALSVWVRDQAGNVRQVPLEIYRLAPR